MPYCSRCGVEVDKNENNCPLCQATIQKVFEDKEPHKRYPPERVPRRTAPPLTRQDRIQLAKTVSTLGFLIPILIVISVDYFINSKISWSVYAMAGLTTTWLVTLMPLIFPRRPYITSGLIHLVIIFLVLFLNITIKNQNWIFPIAVPVILLSCSLVFLLQFSSIRLRPKGPVLAAFILFAISLLCLGIDITINEYLISKLRMGWSLIVCSVNVPVGLMLIYLQSRLSRNTMLRRFFHL